MNTLNIYDKLREAHIIIRDIETEGMTSWQINALEAVNSVLYLAEGVFAKEHE